MASWEEELDLDVSDIWTFGSKVVAKATEEREEEDGLDDLAFTTEAGSQFVTLPATERGSQDAVLGQETQLQEADDADAETQLASLNAGPLPPQVSPHLPSPSLNPPRGDDPALPQFLPTRNSNLRKKVATSQGSPTLPPDIRKYFIQRESFPSGTPVEGGGPTKKRRIPGPVGDIFQRNGGCAGSAADGVDDDGFTKDDDHGDEIFRNGPWLTALQSLEVEEFDPRRYAILKVTASNISSSSNTQILDFVAVIKELTINVFGDAAVLLKDPTGTVHGVMNNKVFTDLEFGKVITAGAAIILRKIAVFSPSMAHHYLNITVNNIVQVFAADTSLPQGPKRLPSPPPLPLDGVATAAKLAGWDLTDDMEAILNDNVDNFYD